MLDIKRKIYAYYVRTLINIIYIIFVDTNI